MEFLHRLFRMISLPCYSAGHYAYFKQDLQLHKTWPESLHFWLHTLRFSTAYFDVTTAQIVINCKLSMLCYAGSLVYRILILSVAEIWTLYCGEFLWISLKLLYSTLTDCGDCGQFQQRQIHFGIILRRQKNQELLDEELQWASSNTPSLCKLNDLKAHPPRNASSLQAPFLASGITGCQSGCGRW